MATLNNTMEWNSEKEPRVGSPDEIQVIGSQVQVVVYDEDQEPPQALAVPLEEAIATEIEPKKPSIPQKQPATPAPAASNQVQQSETTQSPAQRPYEPEIRPTTSHSLPREDGFDCLLCGNTRLKQVRPGFHFVLAMFGNIYLDLLNTPLQPGAKVTILSVRLCGNIVALVPPGTRVIARRIMLCGNRDIDVAEDPEQDLTQPPPCVIVYNLSLCGDIRARSNPDEIGPNYFS